MCNFEIPGKKNFAKSLGNSNLTDMRVSEFDFSTNFEFESK